MLDTSAFDVYGTAKKLKTTGSDAWLKDSEGQDAMEMH